MRRGALPLLSFAFAGACSGGSYERVAPLTLSVETTVMLEPLREDGTPDYALHFQRIYGNGVTPENNAVVPLFGKQILERAPEVARMLGVDPARPPEALEAVGESHELGRLEAYLRQRGGERRTAAELGRAFREQCTRALRGPWTEEEAPLVAAWLDANERSLSRLAEIVRARPRFWLPMRRDHGFDSQYPFMHLRAFGEMLRARALRSFGRGQHAAALEDVALGLRLAALFDQGTLFVERLSAVVLTRDMTEALGTLANPPVDGTAAKALVEELERMPARPSYERTIENERLHLVAAYVDLYRAARGSPGAWNARVRALDKAFRELGTALGSPMSTVLVHVPGWAIDWDELLRTFNRCHLTPACEDERKTAHADLERATLRTLVGAARSDGAARERIARAVLLDQPVAGMLDVPPWKQFDASTYAISWNNTEARLRLARLSAAAAWRRTQEGRYPSSLGPDGAGSHAGYGSRCSVSAQRARFNCTASPDVPQRTGNEGFCVDSSGRFAATTDGSVPDVVDGLCGPAATTRASR